MKNWGRWDWLMAGGLALLIAGWFISDSGPVSAGHGVQLVGLLAFVYGAVWQVVIRFRQRREAPPRT